MITTPAGFVAAGVACGLKDSGELDLALVRNLGPSFAAAATFTQNQVVAAPVTWTREVIKDQQLQAVIINSGVANACTGPDGFADTHATAEAVAKNLQIGAIDVGVCSTGVIGKRLALPAIVGAIPTLVATAAPTGADAAAAAIMTTDTVPKTAEYRGAGWSIGGMGKGAAMLAPGLATMLVILTTDAPLTGAELQTALNATCSATFDRIDADGCMSTNDTVLLLSSGRGERVDLDAFTAGLQKLCAELAAQMVADAEGASHEIAVTITGASSEAEALTAARAVARNNLFKCAIAGNDPYWGRALAAVGATSVRMEPAAAAVAFNGTPVCAQGFGIPGAQVDISARQVSVEVDLGVGQSSATIWTTDLTESYVRLNAEYPT